MKPLIVANWKMNPQSLAEAKRLFNSVSNGLKGIKNTEVVICPPFSYLLAIKPYSNKAIKLGAQDVFWEEKGAFTGEISPKMLKDLGCRYIIIGHSERRRYFNETDEMINKKLKTVLTAKLNPILCIGETKEEREMGKTRSILQRQSEKAFYEIQNTRYPSTRAKLGAGRSKIQNTIIAYEPIWAIGTGKACSPAEAKRAGDFIRSTASKIYNQKFAENLSILYGGSVNSKNAAFYIFDAGFQGLLVGGASLKAKEFIKIIKSVS